MGATGLFQQHPIEVIFVALLGTLLVGWAFGANWLTPWALKLFLGFTAGILFFLGAWAVTSNRMLHGGILIIVGFALIIALGAGWV